MKTDMREFLNECIEDAKVRVSQGNVADWYISGYYKTKELKEILAYLKGHTSLVVHNMFDDTNHRPEKE